MNLASAPFHLASKKELKKLLGSYGIRPSKYLGQHFLVDRRVLKTILAAADLKKNDTILEIGPGLGVLTVELAKRAKKVITIEKDKKLAETLQETLAGYNNTEIVFGDVLRTNFESFVFRRKSYKVVANLPYYIASPVIRMLLESKNPPLEMVLMVQKEVAQRICAKPPKMNLLAVSVQFYAEPKIIRYVSKKSFWPQPKVDSAIIKIVPRDSAYDSAEFREQFFRIVQAGFSHPRKQLLNNLSRGPKKNREEMRRLLLKSGVDPKRRAESLTLVEWIALARQKDWEMVK